MMSNKELIEKYPFLICKNRWTGEPIDGYEDVTELEALPVGWKKAFGEQLCEEIQNELNKMDPVLASDYRILQIKEKYGSLCWYSNWTTMEIDKILRKYEKISERTCSYCGEPATHYTLNWISPYCSNCIKAFDNRERIVPIEDYFKGDCSYEDNSEDI